MNIQLVRATVGDAESLVDIQRKAFKRLYDIYRDEGSPYLRGTEEFHRWLNNPDISIYKIYADGKLCGGIAVCRKTNGMYYLYRVYILPEMQNRGIASKAIEICESLHKDAKNG